jgi:hypothetical protein
VDFWTVLPARYPVAADPATTRAWSARGRGIKDGWKDSIAAAAATVMPVWTDFRETNSTTAWSGRNTAALSVGEMAA